MRKLFNLVSFKKHLLIRCVYACMCVVLCAAHAAFAGEAAKKAHEVTAFPTNNGMIPLQQDGLVYSVQKMTIIASGVVDSEAAKADKPKDKDGNTIVYQNKKAKADTDKKEGEGAAADVSASKKKQRGQLHALEYTIELRDSHAFELEWLPSLNHLNETNAFVVQQAPNQMVNVGSLRTMVAVDVLMVKKNGHILAILPDVVFANLRSDIDAGEDVVAVVFLKGGQAKAQGILPNDEIRHPMFETAPKVLH
jgi:hypothetical protein